MSVVIGEAATKVIDGFPELADPHPDVPWRSMRGMRNRIGCESAARLNLFLERPMKPSAAPDNDETMKVADATPAGRKGEMAWLVDWQKKRLRGVW